MIRDRGNGSSQRVLSCHTRFKMRFLILKTIFSFWCWSPVFVWHDFSNTDFHCWPLSASDQNPVPYNPCKGVDIRWIQKPPETIKVEQSFNATTELILHAEFYEWAMTENLFQKANGGTGVSNVSEAQRWCETTVCPIPQHADQENCCIHHFNLHSCPLNDVSNRLCGPWISADGHTFTHSTAAVGAVTQGNWTSIVDGLGVTGQTDIIAHYKIAGMSLALVARVQVLPKTVCGDGVCEGDSGEDCSVCPKDCGGCPLQAWRIGLIVAAGVAVLLGFIIFWLYLQYQKRKLLLDDSWIYPYNKIRTDMDNYIYMGSVISRRSLSVFDDVTTGSGSAIEHAARRQIFTKIGKIDGKTVAIRMVNKRQFHVTRKIREEVRTIRELDHQNICRFIGGCVEVPHVCIIMEYCPKGGLNDVLLNDDVPLSWAFRFSFASDIARGMGYLHGHKLVHGNLTSSNCVVDDRWTVKITDYGLPTFGSNEFTDDLMDEKVQEKKKRVYRPPEQRVSEEGDVYAYGVVVLEIATRNDPYEDQDPDCWQPVLPALEKERGADDTCPCPNDMKNIMSLCWRKNPQERPSFELIKKMIYKINPNKQNPVDLMMHMMEKYSKHLESLVNERTRDLIIEKQKTDRLLYSMLPKQVADVLRQGNPVQAETFDACTIFFSDIVGFTCLCSSSSAMEVVFLLNKLYVTFDEVIERRNVYKVETIGDAYMVVSGVPKPTSAHASEIANMALDLVDLCKGFAIPHKPMDSLKIRVGLHSGPVCAGVVGIKMPRYCLFGDTVNTASRMESNGEAYRIHLSETTFRELDRTGGFQCERRGELDVKGKGKMTTYWLTGQADLYDTKEVKSSTDPQSVHGYPRRPSELLEETVEYLLKEL